ncbi:hypothetical protein CBS147320_8649 [Aspergillus niger]|nr:hypothetical protein CBS147320_8649 [Aspergillus niger]
MSKLITVVGATGAQGGSVVASALKSGNYKVRGITRNVNSEAAKALTAQGVEMVSADANDEASLVKAFKGSYAIFAVTDFFAAFAQHNAEESIEIEASQGINLAKAAAKTPTLKHYIWSTLPDNRKISGGTCSVPHFESKFKVDQFIKQDRDLLAKTTFLWVTYYASNIVMPMIVPNFVKSSGKHLQVFPVSENTPITTMGDTRVNTGIYALAILDQPHLTLPGKVVLGATETRTAADVLKLWSEVSGKPAEYVAVSLEHYDKLWPKWGLEVGLMFKYWEVAGEKSWTSPDEQVLTSKDLKITGLVGMKEVFAEIDWS